jgi:tetratricopeptide (TPR) repeat protein
MVTLHAEVTVSTTVAQDRDRLESGLVWAIRAVAALLAVALVGLGAYYYQRYSHTTLSVVDRDTRIVESQIRQRPDDLELRVAAANLYVAKGQYDEAISQAEEVLKMSPDHLGALLVLAQAQAQKGRRDLAIGYLTRAVELNKDNPMARASLRLALIHHNLGSLYLDQGQTEQAIAEFRQALAIDPTNADTLHLLGNALARQGHLDEAIQTYRQALRLVPDFPEAYQDLYRAYEGQGDHARADFASGMILYSAGKYGQALESLHRVAAAVPEMAEVHLGLAMTYEKTGDRAAALGEYRLALAEDGTSLAARQGIGRLGAQP